MQHGERERELMIEVARLRRELEHVEGVLSSAFGDLRESEKRADAAEAELAQRVRDLNDSNEKHGAAMEALAAARRECEGLKETLSAALEWLPPEAAMVRSDIESLIGSRELANEVRSTAAAITAAWPSTERRCVQCDQVRAGPHRPECAWFARSGAPDSLAAVIRECAELRCAHVGASDCVKAIARTALAAPAAASGEEGKR